MRPSQVVSNRGDLLELMLAGAICTVLLYGFEFVGHIKFGNQGLALFNFYRHLCRVSGIRDGVRCQLFGFPSRQFTDKLFASL